MGEPYLTMAEIEATYPNEWVLIANPTKTRAGDVTGGAVVVHCADRVEFDARWREFPHVKVGAVLFTGKVPADAEVEETEAVSR